MSLGGLVSKRDMKRVQKYVSHRKQNLFLQQSWPRIIIIAILDKQTHKLLGRWLM